MRPQKVHDAILVCTRCPLSSRAGVTPVPFSGFAPSQIAVVGEAPGFEENLRGKPFVQAGASGNLLRKTLIFNGIDLDECFVCNTVCCFPDASPTLDEQNACRVHLKRQLKIADPRFVLILGAVALRYFDPDLRVSACHGQWREVGGRLLFPCFHPSAALRDPERRGAFEKDIAHFGRLVQAG